MLTSQFLSLRHIQCQAFLKLPDIAIPHASDTTGKMLNLALGSEVRLQQQNWDACLLTSEM